MLPQTAARGPRYGTGRELGVFGSGIRAGLVAVMHKLKSALFTLGLFALMVSVSAAREPSHAEEFDQLKSRMRRINDLVYERTLTPLQTDQERGRQARAISETAADLAAAAMRFSHVAASSFADDAGREAFVAGAMRLAEAARALEVLAADGRFSELDLQIHRLDDACAACHADFRGRQ